MSAGALNGCLYILRTSLFHVWKEILKIIRLCLWILKTRQKSMSAEMSTSVVLRCRTAAVIRNPLRAGASWDGRSLWAYFSSAREGHLKALGCLGSLIRKQSVHEALSSAQLRWATVNHRENFETILNDCLKLTSKSELRHNGISGIQILPSKCGCSF